MDETEIRKTIEELGLEIPSDKLEDFIQALTENKKNPLKDGDSRTFTDENGEEKVIYFHTLKEKMEHETDWRERARIAAQIISLGL